MLSRIRSALLPWQAVALIAVLLMGMYLGGALTFYAGVGLGLMGLLIVGLTAFGQLSQFGSSREMPLFAPVILLLLALMTWLSLAHAPTLVEAHQRGGMMMLIFAEVLVGTLSLALALAAVPWNQTRMMAQQGPQQGPQQTDAQNNAENYRMYHAQRPGLSFADLYGMEDLKAQLRGASDKWRNRQGNGILLFGPPGTGKTAFANAVAGELGLPIITISFGSLASRWVGQMTERFMALMRDAQEQAPCVLFMDEIESILRSRDDSSINDESLRLVSTFLSEIQSLRAHGGVLFIGATNHLEMIDAAAIRAGRFDFRAEVGLPDTEARKGLIVNTLRSRGAQIGSDVLKRLSVRWEGFNIPTITSTVKAAVEIAQESGQTGPIPFRTFYAGLRRTQGPKASAPDGSLRLSDLALNADVRDQLEGIAHRLRNMDEYEEQGGKIARGLLLYGPPGTGKTTIARSMALEARWPLIVRNGKDLTSEDAIADLRKEAGTYRPAIVFIDEADDILGHRAYSNSHVKSATNALLTLIDGAGGALPDVLWMAATNHPDSIDSAALRGGRFETHVYLGPLDEVATARLVTLWLQQNPKAEPQESDWMLRVVPLLAGMAPADIQATLHAANDAAIDVFLRQKGPRGVTVEQVEQALLASNRQKG